MLLVKTYLNNSPIHGIGVFADQFIPKGTKIWEFTEGFDKIVSEDDLQRLTDVQRRSILFYSYREIKINQIILCCDNARHFNFSLTPNTSSTSANDDDISSYALHSIQQGEEFTFSVDEDLDAKDKLSHDVYQSLS